MEKREEVIDQLIEVINSAKLKKKEVLDIMIEFMYCLGQSLEKKQYKVDSPEDLLIDFAENPTIGTALMSQALWMKDTWKGKE